MLMSEILSDRLKKRMKALDVSQAELARRVGITQPSIFKLLTGASRSSVHINAIAQTLETTAAYLTGLTDDPVEGALPKPTPELLAEQMDIVQIPQIDARYSMGGGSIIEEVKAEPMLFSRAWIRQFTTSPVSELFWTEGDGDSMMPTIGPRDILLGDRSQNQPTKSDQIWAITQYGHGQIKRLRATADGYTILSDNPSIPPDSAYDGSMHIIGRIIAVVRRV